MYNKLSQRISHWNYAALVCCLLFSVGCGSDGNSATGKAGNVVSEQSVETPYAVWNSAESLTAFELSVRLQLDTDYANKLCSADSNQPGGYDRHIGLVSTADFDRVDAAERYGLNPYFPVNFGDSGMLLARHLGDILAQRGKINPAITVAKAMVRHTLSKDGRFTGYCDSEDDYQTGYNVVGDQGRMIPFSASCHEPGHIVCLSIKD